MLKTLKHLDDEHMQLYEWSGAGAACVVAAQFPRAHPRHASYGVLALMSGLLILSGCYSKNPAVATSERGGDKSNPTKEALYEEVTSKPASEASAEAAGYALGEAPAEAPAR